MKTSSKLAALSTVQPYFIQFAGSMSRDLKALSIDTRFYNYPTLSMPGVHRLTKGMTNLSGIVSEWSIVDNLIQQSKRYTVIDAETIYSVKIPRKYLDRAKVLLGT